GVAVMTALGLTTGVGLGLTPARADDKPAATKPAAPTPSPGESDAAYLNRLCQDLRGSNATTVEKGYFTADADTNKRRKVVDWLMADETVRAHLAKKHGVEEGAEMAIKFYTQTLAFSPDGTKLAVELNHPATFSILRRQSLNTDAGLNGVEGTERNFDLYQDVPVQGGVVDYVVPPNTGFFRTQSIPATWYARLLQVQAQPDSPQRAWVELYTTQAQQPHFLHHTFVTQPEARSTYLWVASPPESDADFLKRVVKSARGTDPTAIEQKYFADDKDAKKQEKLLDSLLKEPGVAKKLGDDWKKKMLEHGLTTARVQPTYEYRVVTKPTVEYYRQAVTLYTAPQPDRLDKLLGEMIDAKKTDAQILDALTLAIVGRQPAAGENLVIAAVAKAADRKAAWGEVIKALAATDEAKKYAADLTKRNPPEKK
ncbi:MAG TPA: hypothetical protein VMZ71_14335, partial [Gemmataceae bacterium]|nr:hypothetical protein [Gemmataceae bacterium]